MSIRSISSTTPGLGFAQPRPGGPAVRRAASPDQSGLSALSWGDRELIGAVFGADLLTTGRDEHGEPMAVPSFVWLVIEDRRSGRLPAGSEITSSYLHTVREVGPDLPSGTGPAAGPPPAGTAATEMLTEAELSTAMAFISRREQGATVDIRA